MMFGVVQLAKVYQQGASFSGCLFNVVYNGAPLSLWQSVLRSDSRAACCRKPTSTAFPVAVPTLSALTFLGFGYIVYDRQTLPRSDVSLGLQLKFRTFTPDAVVLLLTSVDSDVADYCGIFLNGGKIQWYISLRDGSVFVETRRTYNTGNWYTVCGQSVVC